MEDQIGVTDHIPRFVFEGVRYIREDHFLAAMGLQKTYTEVTDPAEIAKARSVLSSLSQEEREWLLQGSNTAVDTQYLKGICSVKEEKK